ncbi:MAG TPA: hypothetical protein QF753_20235 [Victivallales bacterium]|nr:hypothetical protein [Victivallales bacterium]
MNKEKKIESWGDRVHDWLLGVGGNVVTKDMPKTNVAFNKGSDAITTLSYVFDFFATIHEGNVNNKKSDKIIANLSDKTAIFGTTATVNSMINNMAISFLTKNPLEGISYSSLIFSIIVYSGLKLSELQLYDYYLIKKSGGLAPTPEGINLPGIHPVEYTQKDIAEVRHIIHTTAQKLAEMQIKSETKKYEANQLVAKGFYKLISTIFNNLKNSYTTSQRYKLETDKATVEGTEKLLSLSVGFFSNLVTEIIASGSNKINEIGKFINSNNSIPKDFNPLFEYLKPHITDFSNTTDKAINPHELECCIADFEHKNRIIDINEVSMKDILNKTHADVTQKNLSVYEYLLSDRHEFFKHLFSLKEQDLCWSYDNQYRNFCRDHRNIHDRIDKMETCLFYMQSSLNNGIFDH